MKAFLTAIVFSGALALAFSCDEKIDPTCRDLCEELTTCNLLPSALGVGQDPEERTKNCESRCSAALEQEKENDGTDPDAGQSDARNVLHCYKTVKTNAVVGGPDCSEQGTCPLLASCLDGLLPAAGGVSQLVVRAVLTDAQEAVESGCLEPVAPSSTTSEEFCRTPILDGTAGAGAGGGSGQDGITFNSFRLLLPAGAEGVDDNQDFTLKCDEALTKPFPAISIPAGQHRLRFKILGTETKGDQSEPYCSIVQSAYVRVPAGRSQTVDVPIPTDLGTKDAPDPNAPPSSWTFLKCEMCSDGQDDDEDGFTDCADEACPMCDSPPLDPQPPADKDGGT